ncbi:glycosyltransferase [Paraburkholderia humisilvae]|uniref:Glycosyltransferase 2-like domain-containing protein n=1 Tax=Paraburkholderia humisilvae TaxID=627669 RepID=A0A6J5F5K0_9BURK|nr:glycosyltransferase [Paraburkholderia humisilvae]CAB3773041.1 hypothetical protein LMG29542_07092 [Paraburkholderia humisilvae]
MVALDIFVVLYRRDPSASETLLTLSRIDFQALHIDVEVYVWDNAREALTSPDMGLLPFMCRYRWSRENEPLSKIYNTLLRLSRGEHVVIFDQDSSVDDTFFRKLVDSINVVHADLFVPVIWHEGEIISPGRLQWIKGAALRGVSPNTLLPVGFTAMMSGLCIRRAFLVRLAPRPFDERLHLYGVDTRFCRDVSNLDGKALVTGAVLGHDSALRSTVDPQAVLQRKIWLWQSWLYVFDRNLLEALAIRCYVLWKILRVSVGPRAPGRFLDVMNEVFR